MYLQRKQAELDADIALTARRQWEQSQRTRALQEVKTALRTMAGRRHRCMFCGDTRGTDIDHFRPIVAHRERTFVWANLLWVCGSCNRAKSDRFQVGGDGRPLLIDPTEEDPWHFLYFEPRTGNITAKFDAVINAPDLRGEHTVQLLALNHEAVTEGRQATRRNLEAAVRAFLAAMAAGGLVGSATEYLKISVIDNADHGLSVWYFQRDGADEQPFRDLREMYQAVWLEIQTVV